MENQTPEVITPQRPKSNPILWVVIGSAILASGIGIGLVVGKYFQSVSSTTSVSIVPSTPILSPTVVPVEEDDLTANWKTYTNNIYSYSFKYPENFQLTEESNDRVRISNNLPPDPSCKGGGCNLEIQKLTIYFEHINNPGEDKLSLDEFTQQRRNTLLGIDNEQGNIQTLQKYGYVMKYFDGITEGYNHNYVLKLNENIPFTITVVFPSKEEAVNYAELEAQILSTFKFVGQNVDQNIDDVFNKIRIVDSTIRWDAVITTDTFRYPAQNGTDLPVQKISFTATGKEDFNKVNKIVDTLKEDGWKLDNNNSASGVGASYESYTKNIKGVNYLLVFGFNNSNIWFVMSKI